MIEHGPIPFGVRTYARALEALTHRISPGTPGVVTLKPANAGLMDFTLTIEGRLSRVTVDHRGGLKHNPGVTIGLSAALAHLDAVQGCRGMVEIGDGYVELQPDGVPWKLERADRQAPEPPAWWLGSGGKAEVRSALDLAKVRELVHRRYRRTDALHLRHLDRIQHRDKAPPFLDGYLAAWPHPDSDQWMLVTRDRPTSSSWTIAKPIGVRRADLALALALREPRIHLRSTRNTWLLKGKRNGLDVTHAFAPVDTQGRPLDVEPIATERLQRYVRLPGRRWARRF